MIFSASPWWFLLLALLGLWLTYHLYFRSGMPLGARWRRMLAALTGLAWIALAWFAVQPFWKLNPEIYHRPVVVLAVDESASYAALGGREAAQVSMDSARSHYESLGFSVRTVGFKESSVLNRALDSLALPNLQAIVLWTDGRFDREGAGAPADWAAPVYPVRVATREEVQGERARISLTSKGQPDQSAELELEWRALGGKRLEGGSIEILAAGKTVWTQNFLTPTGTEPEEQVTSVFPLPAGVTSRIATEAAAHPEQWMAIVRPRDRAKNVTAKNDTVNIVFSGLRRAREVFVRPLTTLDERGLVDALTSDSNEVTAVFPAELKLLPEDVLWARAGRSIRANGGTVVQYYLAEDGEGAGNKGPGHNGAKRISDFDADARVAWREDGASFMPPEVLRLGDIGVDRLRLREPDSSVETMAWAEENGRRGLLVWRSRSTKIFGFASPPIWKTGFHAAGAVVDARALQVRWVHGVAAWVRGPGVAEKMNSRGNARKLDPRDAELARLGTKQETLEQIATASGGKFVSKLSAFSNWPLLQGGQSRESRYRAASLAPTWPVILLIAFLLCAVWGLRKRFQID